MNALKPRKGFVQDELNIERLTPIQWDGIMRAMQNYAKHYHETMQANDFEKPQEQCTIPDVSHLLAFLVWYRKHEEYHTWSVDVAVEQYIKANCG